MLCFRMTMKQDMKEIQHTLQCVAYPQNHHVCSYYHVHGDPNPKGPLIFQNQTDPFLVRLTIARLKPGSKPGQNYGTVVQQVTQIPYCTILVR